MNKEFMEGAKQFFTEKMKTDPDFIKGMLEAAKAITNYPAQLKRLTEEIALLGWFPTGESYIHGIADAHAAGRKALNEYMIKEIECDYHAIKRNLIGAHGNRSKILECAFALHESENWNASIPLFLAQTEGIFCENMGVFLFSEHERRKQVMQERFQDKANQYMPYLYAPFELQNLQYSSGISSSSQAKKLNGPNRNGILHGSRKHLDYGTKENSYKCISLLSYISMIFLLEANE
jgi:hypothetical protein